jgi:hypothetical protein
MRRQTDALQDTVRGILQAAQTGGAADPVPPVNPPEPDHDWLPDGLTEHIVRDRFGTGTKHVGTEIIEFGFDPKGVISNAWLARGAKDHAYPGIDDWWVLPEKETNRHVVTFDNGWVLTGTGTDRSSWTWL